MSVSQKDPPAAQRPIPSKRRSLKLKLVLLIASGAFGLLLAEGMLRVVGYSNPYPYEPDEWCGIKLQPGLTAYWSKEGSATFSVNSFGFRDREWQIEKSEGCLRVAVLGDSYIEALQVSDDEKFGSVLERELNAIGMPGFDRVEVLSFGVSGFGTAQELLALKHHALQFNPDIVLLAFLPANDLRNNSRILEAGQPRPYFELVDDRLEPDFSFRNHPVYQYSLTNSCRFKTGLINSSRLLQLVQVIRTRGTVEPESLEDETARDRVGLDDQCFVEPRETDWQDAWSLTERLIGEIHRESMDHDAMFALATITSGIQVNPDDSKRNAFARRLGVTSLDYSETRIAALGDRLGFSVIRLSGPLLEYAQKHDEYLHGFTNTALGEGHWNSAGHREAARVCAKTLHQQWVSQ